MRFITVLVIVCFGQALKSQTYNSRNNFKGDWEAPVTWYFAWANPTTAPNGINLNIYGYVSVYDDLNISGTNCTLSVYDTLVIYGDLSLGNNTNLIVGIDGLLIIKGNLTVVNNTDIFTNGYIVTAGDFINTSTVYDGSFWTTINPAHVFFGGTVPDIPDEDEDPYPILNCDGTWLDRYSHSGCGYGNETDLTEDPIFEFFSSTCLASISTGSNSPLCEGEKLLLSATGGTLYNWSGPSGFSSNLQNPFIHNISASDAGMYLVQIKSTGCSYTDTVHVAVKPRPVVTLTINTPVCELQTIFLSASGAEEYQWTGPDSFASTLPSPSINYAQLSMQGEYFVKGITNGCADTVSAILEVNQVPDVIASVTTPVCEGSTVILSATGASDYQWMGPENFSSNISKPQISDVNVSASGLYIVTGSASGCTNADTVLLTVNPSPGLSVTVDDSFCEGDIIRLKASGGWEFYWTGPSGFQSNDPNPVIDYALPENSGEYHVKSLTSEGCADSATISFSVKPYPEAYAGEDIIIEDDNKTILQSNSSGFETGEWTIISGSGVFSDKASPVSALSELPEGESIFKWTTANGTCESSDEIMVKVIPLFVPNVITPNSDGKNDNLVISAIGENAEIIIFNRMGITVFSTKNYANDWHGVNNSGNELPDDTYYYVITTGKGHIRKGSVLIKRR